MMRKRQTGFTLIEMMISVIIFTVAVLMSAGTIVLSSRMKDRVEAMREIQDEVRFEAEFISREIQSATKVTIVEPSSISDCKISICDTIIIERMDKVASTRIVETIGPSTDSRKIEMTIDNKSQTISSDKIFLRKLRFIPVYDSLNLANKVAVKVEMSVEEAVYSKLNNFDSSKLQFTSTMAQPTKMELRFIASNIDNF